MYLKSIKYAKRSAKNLYKNGSVPKNPALSGCWLFFRLYVLKLGILGGADGFHYCLSAGLRSFYKYSFLREYLNDQKVSSNLDLDSIW
jgi:hypothetical protein